MDKLGIIAGGGIFPLLIAREARRMGRIVLAACIKGEASESLPEAMDEALWVKLGELGKLTRFFREHAVREVVMAGYIRKPKLFSGQVLPDLEMVKLMASLRNFRDETLLNALAHYLSGKGMTVVDSVALLKDALLPPGVLTSRKPTLKEEEDIRFGYSMARQIAGLDIGQTVVVKDKSVVAVESIEGTDETILRGGRLASHGAVMVKVARPKQDPRFDVPAIGLDTVRAAIDANVSVIAVEAHRVFLFQKEEAVQLADRFHVCITAIEMPQAQVAD